MAENEKPKNNEPEVQKSKRDMLVERFKAKYPDREYTDDEALFGQAGEDYDAYENELNGYREREGKLDEMFRNNPKAARFFTDMAKGIDPMIGYLEAIGVDGITDLMNDPEKQAEYAEANKKHLERLAKEKELEDLYNANFSESMELLKQLQLERGLSDEVIDKAYDLVNKWANEAVVGKYTREAMEMALKAITHDAEMANARSEGETAGRNAKIEEKLRKSEGGDGLPVMGGSSITPQQRKKTESIFDVAAGAM